MHMETESTLRRGRVKNSQSGCHGVTIRVQRGRSGGNNVSYRIVSYRIVSYILYRSALRAPPGSYRIVSDVSYRIVHTLTHYRIVSVIVSYRIVGSLGISCIHAY